MMSNRTLPVTNLSSRRTTSYEMEEPFEYSGTENNVDQLRDGDWAQAAYVASMNRDSSDKMLLLSGSSTPINQQVKFATLAYPEKRAARKQYEDMRAHEDAEFHISSPRRTVNKAQNVMTSILSKGYVLGKGALGKAKSFEEKRRFQAVAYGSASPTTVSKEERLVERWNSSGTFTMNEPGLALSDRTMSALATAQAGVKGAMAKLVPSESSVYKKTHEHVHLTKMSSFKLD